MKKVILPLFILIILIFCGTARSLYSQTAYAYCANDQYGLIGGEGPVSFSLTSPNSITLIQNQSNMNFIVATTWIDDIWYGIEYNTNNLITIDPVTGDRTTIGATGIDICVGMSYDRISGNVYALNYYGDLFTVNTSTGNSTYIGSSGASDPAFIMLSCSPTGNLYAGNMSDQSEYQINPATGAGTLIGDLEDDGYIYFSYAQSWAFSPDNNTIYWACFNELSWEGQLWSVNPEFAFPDYIGNFYSNAEITGIAIPYVTPFSNPPALVSPINNSMCVSITPDFDWHPVTDGFSYRIQISTDQAFNTLILDVPGLTDTNYAVPPTEPLQAITNYWWRVRAYNASGDSTYWSQKRKILTDGTLDSPTQLTPPNEDTGTDIPTKFTWTGVLGAQSYQLQVSTSSDFSLLVIDQANLSALSFGTYSLQLSTTYYWRVKAANNCPSTSNWSPVRSFNTTGEASVFGYVASDLPGLIPQGPCYFKLSSPNIITSIANQSNLPFIYAGTWVKGVWYCIESGSNNLITFDPVSGSRTIIGPTPSATVGLTYNFANDTTYSLQINGGLYSIDLSTGLTTYIGGYADDIYFIQLAANIYGDLFAADIETQNEYKFNYSTKKWDLVAPLVSSDTSRPIYFKYAQDWDFDPQNNVLYWTMFNDNSNSGELWTVDPATGICTYIDPFYGNADISGFAIPYQIPCLGTTHLISPADNANCISRTPSFLWKLVSPIAFYTLQISLSTDFSSPVLNVEGILSNSYTIPAVNQLNPLTLYYWRVSAHNVTGCSGWWSRIYHFCTEGPIPPVTLITPENGATNVKDPTKFTWEPIIGVTQYNIQISSVSNFSTLIKNLTIADTFSKPFLPFNSECFWRVRAMNQCDTGSWSETYNFTTSDHLPTFAYFYVFDFVGPGYFYLDDPGDITLIADKGYQYLLSSGTWMNGNWYAFDLFTYRLVKIEPESGNMNYIGSNDSYRIVGITNDITTNTLYGLSYYGDLLTINPQNGLINLVGLTPVDSFLTLACRSDGILYAVSKTGPNMYIIDKQTGNATLIGQLNQSNGRKMDIVPTNQDWNFDLENDILYWSTVMDPTGERDLWTVDPNTAICTFVKEFYLSAPNVAMAIPYNPPCLSNVSLTYPENKSYCIPVDTTFGWDQVKEATTYKFQLSTSQNFSDIVLNIDSLTTNSYTLPPANQLSPHTQYWWRVRAYNDSDCSSWWSVKYTFFSAGPLSPVTLVNPENGATNIVTNPALSWEAVNGATSYHIQISSVSDFSTLIMDSSGIKGVSIKVNNLVFNSMNYWRVQAVNPCGTGPWSETFHFSTTMNVILGNGPYYNSPTNYPTPYGRYYTQSREQYIIKASEILDQGGVAGDFTSLAFNVATLNNCDAMMNFSIKIKMLPNTNFSVDGLTEVYSNDSYQPVIGINEHRFTIPFTWDGVSNLLFDVCFNNGILDWTNNASTYWSGYGWNCTRFTYDDMDPEMCSNVYYWESISSIRPNMLLCYSPYLITTPQLLSPINNSLNYTVAPLLSWTDLPSISNYHLQVSTEQDFSSTIIDQYNISTQYYQLPTGQLSPTTQYYWRVMAFDTIGNNSLWSRCWNFITAGPLSQPQLIAPAYQANDIKIPFTFDWNNVVAAQSYMLEVSTDSSFINNIIDRTLSSSNYSSYELEIGTQYFWHVRAENAWETSPWSAIWTFNTRSYVTLGQDTTHNDVVSYPAPYGNHYSAARHQILFQAEELANACLSPGEITSIGWDVFSLGNTNSFQNFIIRMKNTNADTILTLDYADLQQVYFYPNYMPCEGWNIHIFNEPFTWDGVSNVLVDVCFNNGAITSANNVSTYYTQTIWNSCIYARANDNPFMCSPNVILSQFYSKNRPNTIFGMADTVLRAPILTSPRNGTANTNLNLTLDWGTVNVATQYEVQVSNLSTFEIMIFDVFTTDSYKELNNLQQFTLYYWRVKSIDGANSSQWSAIWHFQTAGTVPWTVIANTGNNSLIIVPANINPVIGNRPFGATDAIGLFYQSSLDEWVCGGIGIWNGQDLGITVWGDNPLTSVKDGFSSGDAYIFRVWDGEAGVEYNATASYQSGPSTYQANSYSVLNGLSVNVPASQSFNLPVGWSMISSYVIPNQPDLDEVFYPQMFDVIIMKNGLGQNYIPPAFINEIGDWNVIDGYLIKTNPGFEFTINGLRSVPEVTPIPLIASWNLISYLRTSSMPVSIALSSLGNSVILIKNGFGQMYVPAYNINQIGNMNPGEGYYLYVNATDTLFYPPNGAFKAVAGESTSPMPKHLLPDFIRTGNNASLILNINAMDGDEIGIYNTIGELIGSGIVQKGLAAITIWGDDKTTETIEGAVEGELLTAKLLDVETGVYTDILLTNIKDILTNCEFGKFYYSKNCLFTANATLQPELTKELSISNIPNPFSGTTSVRYSIPDNGNVEINIFNIQGEQVSQLIKCQATSGTHELNFNSGNLSSGVYSLVMRFGSQEVTTMMMIVK